MSQLVRSTYYDSTTEFPTAKKSCRDSTILIFTTYPTSVGYIGSRSDFWSDWPARPSLAETKEAGARWWQSPSRLSGCVGRER